MIFAEFMTRLSHVILFFFSSRRRHTRFDCDWSSDVCSSDLVARLAGNIYASNTVGGIVGALGFSLALVPIAGTQGAQRWIIGLSAVGGGRRVGGVVFRRRGGLLVTGSALLSTRALAVAAYNGKAGGP